MKRIEYLRNEKINGIEFLYDVEGRKDPDGRIRRMAIFLCPNCKKHFLQRIADIKSGKTISCGCVKIERGIKRLTKHGLKYHIIYTTWRNVHDRCYNKNKPGFENYGGRGIQMQKKWINNFIEFYNYVTSLDTYIERNIGNSKDQLSIDRIDNDGNYEEGNIRWATRKQQANNRRKWLRT